MSMEINKDSLPASDMILIVDDDEFNRAVLENIFSAYYSTDEAEDGDEGLEKILADPNKYCAILLDVMMPRMNGIEVVRHLNENGLLEKIPVFLITAEANNDTLHEAYRLGVMDVILKPVTPYIVLRRINSVVELFRARKQLGARVEQQDIELIERAQKIIELNKGMIEALSTAVEFRDGESGEHVRRIHDITKFFLENTKLGAGLSSEEIDNIALASIMHDIGKIAIPDHILQKPGRLTPEEFEIMKTHTTQGANLLEKIPQLRNTDVYEYAYDIARHHHERWNGRGYPDGLKGDEISLWAQIVSLADVYDALSCKRVYKDAFPREKVLQMIRDGECGAFNPKLLECFFEVEETLSGFYR